MTDVVTIVTAEENISTIASVVVESVIVESSTQGPAGAQGIQGPQGPQGIQGIQGPQGDAADANAAVNDHLQVTNPHNITKTTLGLSNVENYSAAGMPISTATQNALDTKLNVQAGITAGTFNNITVGTNGLVTGGSNVSYVDANSNITPGTFNTITYDAKGLVTGGSNTSYLIPGAAITLPNLTNALNSGNYSMYYKSNVISSNGDGAAVSAHVFDSLALEPGWDDLITFKNAAVTQARIDPSGGGFFNILGQGYTQIGNDTYNAVAATFNDKLLVTSGGVLNEGVRTCSITSEINASVISSNAVGQALNCFTRTSPESIGDLTQTTLGGSLRNRYAITHQGTGTVSEASSVSANLTTSLAGSLVTNYQAFNVETATQIGACTNFFGLHMRNQTLVTNQYGVYVDSLTAGTVSNYAIYTAGATPSYFGGSITSNGGLYLPTGSAIYFNNSIAVKVDSATSGVNIGLTNTQSSSGTAIGASNTANNAISTAIGSNNTATNVASAALGYGNAASGVNSVAIGYTSTASGGTSVALGMYCTASVSSSVAMGLNVNNSVANSLQIGSSNTAKITILSTGLVGINNTNPLAALDITGDTIGLRTARTPTAANSTGNAGDICWDTNYVYVCVATNVWKRSPIATWP